MNKEIKVEKYNSNWPLFFVKESILLKQALGEKCIAVHHVGSTAVPGLAAKPKIDIIAVVKDIRDVGNLLVKVGYLKKGREVNIPFHLFFSKDNEVSYNLHVYEEGSSEITLNLLFRNYLRDHPSALKKYAALKQSLVSQKEIHGKNGRRFSGYTLGKDHFIKETLKKAGFKELCLRFCAHDDEWAFAHKVRKIDPLHTHFVLYQGAHIIGYADVDKDVILELFILPDDPLIKEEFHRRCNRWIGK
jgi:GrpB-like predicted nucleotidyltransferase (UPF0157 family)